MKGRRFSRKREAIMEKLASATSHPTAEWIHSELKCEHPDIGVATVYRNLSEFRERGEIISLGTINGQERFDATTVRHDHFICESCGAIIDVPHDSGCEGMYAKIAPELKATVSRHHVFYYGKCGKC
ncbi:MAG: transcriptional repressor [Oscillospiraceae bacterium]|nr:transcriptional repressor [Oscillospiraceae bacterium]